MELVEKKPLELTQNDGNKLKQLLDGIDEIITTEQGTIIKFKGNLITSTEGTQIFHSENGHIVQLAKTIHLNPPLEQFMDVNKVNEDLLDMKQSAKELLQAKDDCGCSDC